MIKLLVGLVLMGGPAPSIASLQAEVTRLQTELAACRTAAPTAAPTASPAKLADEETVFSFKEFAWGQPLAAVKKARPKGSLQETGVYFVDPESVADLDALLILDFIDNGLAQITAIFRETHSDDSAYVIDFERVKKRLVEKYGEPSSDEPFWKNELFRSEPLKLGTAIAAGHYARRVTWNLSDTKITLSITGDNFKVRMGLDYVSSRQAAALKAKREKARLQGL